MADSTSEIFSINVEDLFSIAGKVALVTGGSRGIGKMIAQGFLQSGAKVYISSRKADACDRTVSELSEHGEIIALPADLATPEGRASLVQGLKDRESALNVLVNNAGATWGADIDNFPDDGFRKVVELNLNAQFFITRDLLPLLDKGGSPDDPARIVNIGSMDGLRAPTVAQVGTFPYSASKAALHHLTRALAIDLGPRNITTNAIAPGFFRTKLANYVIDNHGDDIRANCPLGRLGKPEELVGIALYLSSRAGAYTNGAVIPVDGGANIA